MDRIRENRDKHDVERNTGDKASFKSRFWQGVPLFATVFALALPALYLVLQIDSCAASKPESIIEAETIEVTAEADDSPPGVGSGAQLLIEERAPRLLWEEYTVVKGDTVSEIAKSYGLAQDTILSFNDIRNSRLLQIGQILRIPNHDGILHSVTSSDTVDAISQKYGVEAELIRSINELESGIEPDKDTKIFIPSARLKRVTLQEINGDLFAWPVKGYISSKYGYRNSPFTGVRQFHSGLDIAAPMGTIVKAAMDGKVSATGFDVNAGNYIYITHHSGYRSFYAHLSVIKVTAGQKVKTGQRIGDVGSTGLSTGSHLHFGVFKNGITVNPLNLMH